MLLVCQLPPTACLPNHATRLRHQQVPAVVGGRRGGAGEVAGLPLPGGVQALPGALAQHTVVQELSLHASFEEEWEPVGRPQDSPGWTGSNQITRQACEQVQARLVHGGQAAGGASDCSSAVHGHHRQRCGGGVQTFGRRLGLQRGGQGAGGQQACKAFTAG